MLIDISTLNIVEYKSIDECLENLNEITKNK